MCVCDVCIYNFGVHRKYVSEDMFKLVSMFTGLGLVDEVVRKYLLLDYAVVMHHSEMNCLFYVVLHI